MADTKDQKQKESRPFIGAFNLKADPNPEEEKSVTNKDLPDEKVEVSKDEEKVNEPEEPKCGNCEGLGISGIDRVGNDTICTVCAGTGKVS